MQNFLKRGFTNSVINQNSSNLSDTLDLPERSSRNAFSKFALWNARSIRSKTSILAEFVISNQIEMMAVTESWLFGDHRVDIAIADLTSSLVIHYTMPLVRIGPVRGACLLQSSYGIP